MSEGCSWLGAWGQWPGALWAISVLGAMATPLTRKGGWVSDNSTHCKATVRQSPPLLSLTATSPAKDDQGRDTQLFPMRATGCRFKRDEPCRGFHSHSVFPSPTSAQMQRLDNRSFPSSRQVSLTQFLYFSPEKGGQVHESSDVSAVDSEGECQWMWKDLVFIIESTIEGPGELFRFTTVPNP